MTLSRPFNPFTAAHPFRVSASAFDMTQVNLLQGARVYNSTDIIVPTSGSWGTALTFDSERYDPNGYHSLTLNPGRLTVPMGRGGIHDIVFSGEFQTTAADGGRGFRLIVNGTTVIAVSSINAAAGVINLNWATTLTAFYNLASGDFVEVQPFQNGSGNQNVVFAASYSPEFMIVRRS